MSTRTLVQRVGAMSVSEGAGVTVRRSIGLPALRRLDPFLMLDCFGTDNPDDYIAGFPDHPHRGFITFTYMLDGHMLHQDSMGNRGDLLPGAAQWMKAASGVIHSEMPQQREGLMRGFQLWINLPAAQKMSDPAYQEFGPDAFPHVEVDGVRVKVLIGEYGGVRGPVEDPHTQVQYLDVALPPGNAFSHRLDADMTAFVYPYEGGKVDVAGEALRVHELGVLGSGEAVEITGGDTGARFLLVAGRPLGEPVAQYGPFVMNSREEIEQAFSDYRDGNLVRKRAQMIGG